MLHLSEVRGVEEDGRGAAILVAWPVFHDPVSQSVLTRPTHLTVQSKKIDHVSGDVNNDTTIEL